MHREQCIALFSHGDVIKAAVAYALGVPLDLFGRIEISSGLGQCRRGHDYGPWVLAVNNTGRVELPDGLG